jgi:toxin YoeB
MKIIFTPNAHKDIEYWKSANKSVLLKIFNLLDDIQNDPFQGLGKPEPLKGDFSGYWSRRITQEHRLVYKIDGKGKDKTLLIYQCRYHYTD